MLAVGLQGVDPLGERDGVRVQGVDGADDLGELVVAAGEGDRFLGGGVLGPGEPGGTAAQHGEGAGEGAGHGGGDADGQQHQGAEDRDAQLQRGDVVVAQLGELLDPAVEERGLRAAHEVDAGGEGRVELAGAGAEFAVGEGGLVGQGGQVLVGGVDLGTGDRGVVARLGGGGRGLPEVGEGRVGAQPGLLGGGAERVTLLGVGGRGDLPGGRQAGDRVVVALGRRRHAERREQQSAGGGGLLYGGVQLGEE